MAADHASDPHPKDHVKTYTGFLNVTKWAVLFVIVLLIGLFAFVFGE